MTYFTGCADHSKKKINSYLKPKINPSYVNGDSYLWLLKPTNTNRGSGIFIFNTLDELEKHIFQFQQESDQINNCFIHLTNNAIQRFSDNYGEFEKGNQLSLQSFFEYCKKVDPNIDIEKMHSEMKNITMMTMQAAKKKINAENIKHTFEIFGYDFIIDYKFNIFLIEVNTNPCLDESSPHLQQCLKRMLDDGFKLTVDQIFPKKQKDYPFFKSNSQVYIKQSLLQKNSMPESLEQQDNLNLGQNEGNKKGTKSLNNSWPIDGFSNQENMWEYLGSIYYKTVSKSINQRKPF
ncbi:tubulin-tyrosine ligase family protein, putative [Ichthyophthirius multifiliis]|uniref:Tubulin-tyrosine ligase family protein, putative n=1 Tax=Ichthyophthirius multifiliis TaxID=5932 RepID=G0QV53_ICHMU|nr:tubulin-tyrosine ligase family protein, putative [Ichthyophthirius multifiliis]EGR30894.1 tubulin-tyrosine ligase family protein, putative [Ichthyophthirius multifiliis]|eukprot:XP_004032481.1 tubulin-tyrosine ligase family protein, putative [Ichthyophthirius multifiliis]